MKQLREALGAWLALVVYLPLFVLIAVLSLAWAEEQGAAILIWVAVLAFVGWQFVDTLAEWSDVPAAARVVAPFALGAVVLIGWEVIVRALDVPSVILPPPSQITGTFLSNMPTLWADFVQTILKGAMSGYVVGCLLAFGVAILVDRYDFLRRGLLPVGNFMAALPIVGTAPILVMWFGFDWQSKAAVVVVMVFFPMLVNIVAGLADTSAMQRDLMRTYSASYWQTLMTLRLPAALPFVFNGLKVSATLALIGAIVAEFFGSPTVGLGFRINASLGQLALDMVWSVIVVAALAGSLLYGFLTVLERWLTFWHPSQRR